MKHASAATLDLLEPLLVDLRKLDEFVERKRGIFYRKGRAFLHFHEDPAGLFADLRDGEDFVRYRVQTLTMQRKFLKVVRDVV